MNRAVFDRVKRVLFNTAIHFNQSMLLVENAHPMSPLMLKCTNVLDMF